MERLEGGRDTITPEQILSQYFGYDAFRPGQRELIGAVLSGRDALGIMPTGAGKSVCYQVPAMLLPGLTVVISPLISLMHDQVGALRQNGIPAAYLNSSLDEETYRETLSRVLSGEVRLLYAAPERLETQSFLRIAHNIRIALIAVDEAHCVSQWGQDFRPSYLRILRFIEEIPYRPPIAAFTATATPEVAEDILRILALHDPFTITTGFDRQNLYLGVMQPRDKMAALMEILQRHPEESGIVYCATRKVVEQVTEDLCLNGISAAPYHAGMGDEARRRNQEDFLYDRVRVIVATNAFGMGIDKSDVRFVVHYQMPKNIESYYQEAGRAGRDGSPAECILLYGPADVRLAQFMISKDNENDQLDDRMREEIRRRDEERLKQMTFYCTRNECLREHILRYFGEKVGGGCGNCSACRGNYERRDISVDAQKIVSCVYRLEKLGLHFGPTGIADILMGSQAEKYEKFHFEGKLSTFGIMKGTGRRQIVQMIEYLLSEDWISIENEHRTLRLNKRSAQLLRDRPTLTINVVKEEKPAASRANTVPEDVDDALFAALRECRKKLAQREGVPPYFIFTDTALIDMARKRPTNDGAFLAVNGVGRVKLEKYGNAFLKVIRDHAAAGAGV